MTTTTPTGLTAAEVAERIADGRVNDVPDAPVRTTGQIIRANTLTPVNAIMGTLFVLILVAGYPQDALFVGVVISNTVIGVAQELKARRTLHELELLNAPRARVVRDATATEVAVSEVVADDVLVLAPGDQVVVDGEILDGIGLQIDESLLTGESDPVDKAPGDDVMSGSFVSAGSGHYRAVHVGADAYASRLAEEARVFKLADSELRRGINIILRWLTVIIPPVSILLFWRLVTSEDQTWQEALQGTVAAAVAMVPDGLVLLTSLSFITGVIALARRKALAKELASVELLARVDTLCLDKTGTITTGEISFGSVEPAPGVDEETARAAVGAVAAADPSPNETMRAVIDACPAPPDWQAGDVTPFSSARKWAAAQFPERGSYYVGAPELILDPTDEAVATRVAHHSDAGARVLAVVHSAHPLAGDDLAPERRAVALILLEDTVRPDAPEILAFFREQGVELKVISGDNPATVAAVARRAGVDTTAGVDARGLPEDADELAAVVDRESVFGRVTPHQKRSMVHALQQRGRVVAMTGDGVNDVLALKDADMGISMGSGSTATRSVAQLVLLDNRFATLPRVLAEGRRVINNIERVANLFISKAAYAVLITFLVALIGSPFPFLPRQLTLVGTFSIGVPGFFLALAPNESLVRPGFLPRVLRFSLPAGIAAGLATVVVYEIARDRVSLEEARSAATVCLLLIGLVILVMVARPLRLWKVGLAAGMALGYTLVLLIEPLREFFELVPLSDEVRAVVAAGVVAAGAVIVATGVIMDRTDARRYGGDP